MKYVALTCALLLGGCALHKPTSAPTAPASESIGADALPPDSTSARLPAGDQEFTRINPDTPDEAGPSEKVVVVPHRTLVDKVLGRTPATKTYVGTGTVTAGKKSNITINHVAGNQSNNTNTAAKNAAAGPGATTGAKADGPVAGTGTNLTNIEKPKAPTATGSGAAQDYTKQGQRGGAAASGAGATATATTSKGFNWWLLLIPVVGYAAYRVNKRLTIF